MKLLMIVLLRTSLAWCRAVVVAAKLAHQVLRWTCAKLCRPGYDFQRRVNRWAVEHGHEYGVLAGVKREEDYVVQNVYALQFDAAARLSVEDRIDGATYYREQAIGKGRGLCDPITGQWASND